MARMIQRSTHVVLLLAVAEDRSLKSDSSPVTAKPTLQVLRAVGQRRGRIDHRKRNRVGSSGRNHEFPEILTSRSFVQLLDTRQESSAFRVLDGVLF